MSALLWAKILSFVQFCEGGFSVDEDEKFIPTPACQLFLRRHFEGQTGNVKMKQQSFLRSPILPKYSEVKPWDCSGLHPQVSQVSRQGVKDGEDLLDHCQLAAHEGNAMTSLLNCYVQKEDENLVLVEPEGDVEEANIDEAPNAEHAR